MSRGSGISSRHCEEITKKKIIIIKRDFSCLQELTIKLRESNINKCGHLKISTGGALLYTEQSRLNTPESAEELPGTGERQPSRQGFVVLQIQPHFQVGVNAGPGSSCCFALLLFQK